MTVRVSSRVPDAFDLLGLTPTFDLTPAKVREAYLARVSTAHPDAAPAGSQRAAGGEGGGGGEGDTAGLNAAKTALSDPETRANLLLARLGGPSKETNRELPDGFLMKMMEAREELEAAAAHRDTAAVEKWRQWAEQQRDAHIVRVTALFKEHAAQAGTGHAAAGIRLSSVRRELNAWRYIERMLEQIEEL